MKPLIKSNLEADETNKPAGTAIIDVTNTIRTSFIFRIENDGL